MGERYEQAILAASGAKNFSAEVVSAVETRTAHTPIAGSRPAVARRGPVGATGWVRLWIPATGRLFQRGYTLASVQLEHGTCEVDFLLHEPAGPASRWAADVEPGVRIDGCVNGTDDYRFDGVESPGHLLIGDGASLPAINTVLAAAPPASRLLVLLRREHQHDEKLPVVQHPGADVRWAEPNPDGTAALGPDLADIGPELAGCRCWVALDSTATRRAVKQLRDEHRVPTQLIKSGGYWIRGKSMGTAATDVG